MNNVKMFQAHKEAVRRVSFSPTDAKFASCSDDGTVRVWDFFSCVEERVLRGHGSDVKCVDWHPTKGILGIYDFIEYLLMVSYSQKGILVSSNLPKKNQRIVLRISALASKMGKIK